MRPLFHSTRNQDGIGAEQIISGGRQLAGRVRQDIHEESATQNYSIGTRLVMDDRVFRYSYAKGAMDPLLGARADIMPREGESDAVAYAAGTFYITIPVNANGKDNALEIIEDYWAEGYIWIQTAPQQMYRIKSSAAASGGFIVLTLYEALKTDVTASMWITAWANPYKACVHTHSGKMSVVCQPLISVTIDYYFWGQTWGPCFGTQTATKPGLASGDREVFYGSDGALITGGDVCNTGLAQKAGFLITNTQPWQAAGGGAEGGGDQFYMLQLSP